MTNQELELLQLIDGRQQAMYDTTVSLCNVNSGSYHREGIEAVQAQLEALFGDISDTSEKRELAPVKQLDDRGEVVFYQPPAMQIFRARPEAPLQILCTGHSDTVFAKDSDFNSCWREGELLRGPGVADMKGGLVVLLEGLRGLSQSPYRDQFGFTIAISPDEEIGSPSSAAVLMELAQEADFGLTYEPALADGTLAGARKGSGNFTIAAKGKSTHAGRDFFSGRNAVLAISQLATELSELSDADAGITLNIGKISGGGAVNIVPDNCVCRFNVRVTEESQQQQMMTAMAAIIESIEQRSDCELSLHGHFNRPPKPMTPELQSLFELLRSCGEKVGLNIQWRATGGCCEGNNLAAAGLLNIDTLGVRGANIHSHEEYAYIDSFVERAQLTALFVTKLIEAKNNAQVSGLNQSLVSVKNNCEKLEG